MAPYVEEDKVPKHLLEYLVGLSCSCDTSMIEVITQLLAAKRVSEESGMPWGEVVARQAALEQLNSLTDEQLAQAAKCFKVQIGEKCKPKPANTRMKVVSIFGTTILVDTSDEACSRFGFKHGDRVVDEVGDTGTFLGVKNRGSVKELWIQFDSMGALFYDNPCYLTLLNPGHDKRES